MAQVIETEKGDYEKFLKQLPIELRGKTMTQAVRRGAGVVRSKARLLVPIGDPNHKPDNKPLKDTIAVKVMQYQSDKVIVALVGPRRPDGAHGHLVEDGHRVRKRGKKGEGPGDFTGARVAGKEFLAPAADQTESEQTKAIVDHLRSTAEKYHVG